MGNLRSRIYRKALSERPAKGRRRRWPCLLGRTVPSKVYRGAERIRPRGEIGCEAALETRAIYLEQFTNSQEMVNSAKIPILNFLTSAAQDPDPRLYSGSLFNDPPAFTGAVVIGVIEGGSVTLTEAVVPVFDPDNGSQDIRFTISNLATGSLLLNNQPTLTFTKQQLANGQVRFQHDGSEQPSLNFTISVDDRDEEESPPALASAVITVAPVMMPQSSLVP